MELEPSNQVIREFIPVWESALPISHASARMFMSSLKLHVTEGQAAELYRSVRYADRIPFSTVPGGHTSFRPGLIALLNDLKGKPVTFACLYSDGDGPITRLLPHPRLQFSGSAAVQLGSLQPTNLIVTESLYVAVRLFLSQRGTVWTTVHAGRLARFIPPLQTDSVIVYVDPLATGTDRLYAQHFCDRMKSFGLKANIKLQSFSTSSFNDYLSKDLA